MEPNSGEQKIIDLLSKLKNSDGAYPTDIFESRRQNYLKQVANVGLGIGVGAGLKNAAKSGNGAGTVATVTSKILETALVAAIALEAVTVTYLYRDKIADTIKSYTGSSNVQEVDSPGSEVMEILSTPLVTPSGTPSATPLVTLSPEITVDNNNNDTNPGVNSTPSPGGDNGNQYGLTPKPERTKENDEKNKDDNVNKDK